MPLVKCVCTNCNAPLEVDDQKEAAICKFCGTPFIVEKAINQYINNTTYSINNANILLDSQNIEKSLERFDVFLNKLGDFSKAKEESEKMCEKWPGDYRSWLSKAQVLTNSFHTIREDERNVPEAASMINNAIKVAPPSKKEEIRSIWEAYESYSHRFSSLSLERMTLDTRRQRIVCEYDAASHQSYLVYAVVGSIISVVVAVELLKSGIISIGVPFFILGPAVLLITYNKYKKTKEDYANKLSVVDKRMTEISEELKTLERELDEKQIDTQ